MSIYLDYRLSISEEQRIDNFDLQNASQTDLDFYLFCGDITFRINDKSLDADWGWVPILNFASNIHEISSTIQDGNRRIFEYTESEATITFDRTVDVVQITANYVSHIAIVTIEDLRTASTSFLIQVVSDFCTRWPKLDCNLIVREIKRSIQFSSD